MISLLVQMELSTEINDGLLVCANRPVFLVINS